MKSSRIMPVSTCDLCDKSNAKACATCGGVRYCSKACQEVDWPVHKTLCKKISKLYGIERPETEDISTAHGLGAPSKLGILLSADSPDPKLVWVPCQRVPKRNLSPAYEEAIIHHLLGHPITETIESFNIARNEVRGFELDHTVVLYARDNWLNDGSKPNQAVLALTDWEVPYDWRGNVLIMSNKGLVGKTMPSQPDSSEDIMFSAIQSGGALEPYQDFKDVTLRDFRTAVDYLSRYGLETKRGEEHSSLNITDLVDGSVSELQERFNELMAEETKNEKSRMVKGVLIRCEGDILIDSKLTGKLERYEEVDVAKDNPIWNLQPTGASKIMGLPLLTQKQTHNPAWNSNNHTRFDNQPATFLNLVVDPRVDDMWGFAPPEWQSEVGSVLLVRKDQKDLTRTQAWAMAEFMQHTVSDAFEDAMESGEEKQRRSAVLKMLNWKCFEEFLVKFVPDMRDIDGISWKPCRSPFGTRENYKGQPY